MKLDLGSFAFGSSIKDGGGTPSWGTSLGQKKPDLKLTYPGADNIIMGMMYKSIPTHKVYTPLGKGGHVYNSLEDEGIQLAALFDKVYINEIRVDAPFIMLVYEDSSASWTGRRTLKYNIKIEYRRDRDDIVYNSDFEVAARKALGISSDACWVVSDICIINQDELHLVAGIVNPYGSETYSTSEERKIAYLEAIKATYEKHPHFEKKYSVESLGCDGIEEPIPPIESSPYRPFITAIKSKPFLLLAGISGTGKSRIVRELARACWNEDSEEYKAQKPRNFEMVQVKPNWHDSSELIGYVSRIDGVHYVVGPFLRFMVKAIKDPQTPYFLCLDEMNLAPVEQYFAEYLSVVESRKRKDDGTITTDPIVDYSRTAEYHSLICELFDDDKEREPYLKEKGGKRLCIPQNLIVVGTVNMDETTFSFSRKVLDRAMTIEMNEVNLYGGLDKRYERIGKLGIMELIGTAVEGVDVYPSYKVVCDMVIEYLKKINNILDGTPFKIAYRTRNEALLYVINNLPYSMDVDGSDLSQEYVIARALDEITNMKILSRIEGDETKVSFDFLEKLEKTIGEGLESISEGFTTFDGVETFEPVSLSKLDEMKQRLSSGYTSFWS